MPPPAPDDGTPARAALDRLRDWLDAFAQEARADPTADPAEQRLRRVALADAYHAHWAELDQALEPVRATLRGWQVQQPATPAGPFDRVRAAWQAADIPLNPPDVAGGTVEDILPVLDQLAAAAGGVPPPPPERLDEVLVACREWADALGAIVLPRRWSFAHPAGRAEVVEDGVTEQFFFRHTDAPGLVFRVPQFGARTAAGLLRPAVVRVSAGSAPDGLADLERLLADQPVAAPIRDRLQGWRAAALHGQLAAAATDLFGDFYSALGDDLRAADPDLARAFGDRLAEVLAANFGLRAFWPANVWEHPDGWYRVVGSRPAAAGRVRRVLRPGLADAGGRLRIPALVEVE